MPVIRHAQIGDLKLDSRNARRHPDINRAAVRASLEEFGQVEPLVVQASTGRVIGGNCRLVELQGLGVSEALVAEVDITDQQADRLALILNRSAETAEWDEDNLLAVLRELEQEDALEGLGKPVPLVVRHIRNSSKPGWLVGDPFGGSGTTLIACAETGRQARLIELDPRYCDVIRRRWTRWAREHGVDAGPGALD